MLCMSLIEKNSIHKENELLQVYMTLINNDLWQSADLIT
jgi:hypothetical protein